MSTKQSQTTSPSTSPTSAIGTAPNQGGARQPAGNSAAVERAGIGTSDASYLGGNTGELTDWPWGKAAGAFGLGTEDTKDSWDLAKQTADNLGNATKRLGELGAIAREAGKADVAATIEGAAARLEQPAGLATDLKKLIDLEQRVDLVMRVLQTTREVAEVDLSEPAAAGAFDRWFATLGEAGEAIADAGGMWGDALKPFATFIKLFGEHNLFTAVRENMKAHGWRRQGATLEALHNEGF